MQIERGILVDYLGFFLGALQWDAAGPPPNFNIPRRTQRRVLPADRKYLLRSKAAIDGAFEMGRWNFDLEKWDHPTTIVYLADAAGQYQGKRRVWPSRYSPPEGFIAVDVEPLLDSRHQNIWDAESREWKKPRRVGMIDEQGVVDNIVLENPRADQPDVILPPGWDRFDDDLNWPTTESGNPVGRNDLKRNDGRFQSLSGASPKSGTSPKSSVVAVYGMTSDLQAEFAQYLADNSGLERSWSNLPDQAGVAHLGPFVFKFMRAFGRSADFISETVAAIEAV